ncbi:hypothetical protein FACS1894184_14620 [Clostridia bacterium]|nr:hypothetical protein FACS1894184_14620 [Clostridia bacterium]
MTPFIQMRNFIAHQLSEYLSIPVILSNQLAPEQPYPYVMYTVLTHRIPATGYGNRIWIPKRDAVITALEQINHATISISCCSCDRWTQTDPPVYINGEDEAQTIAERAMDWFEHIGYYDLSSHGIVVVEVMEAHSRTDRFIDEVLRRYGFDIRIRYGEVMERLDSAIETVSIISNHID